MKNAILAISALSVIGSILFMSRTMDSLNGSQESSNGEIDEWMNEVVKQQADNVDWQARSGSTQSSFSECLRDLSRRQQSIATDIAKEFQVPQGKTASDSHTLINTLSQRQAEIVDEFIQFQLDLGEQLEGIADQRHLKALHSMRDADATTHLNEIKAKLSRNQSHQAAEAAKAWAEKMTGWATELESLGAKS